MNDGVTSVDEDDPRSTNTTGRRRPRELRLFGEELNLGLGLSAAAADDDDRRHIRDEEEKREDAEELDLELRLGWIDESSHGRETTALAVKEDAIGPSTIPEASRHPGKEPIGVEDGIEGIVKTPSNQMENGVGGRILEDMSSRRSVLGGGKSCAVGCIRSDAVRAALRVGLGSLKLDARCDRVARAQRRHERSLMETSGPAAGARSIRGVGCSLRQDACERPEDGCGWMRAVLGRSGGRLGGRVETAHVTVVAGGEGESAQWCATGCGEPNVAGRRVALARRCGARTEKKRRDEKERGLLLGAETSDNLAAYER
ncbi:uncharacterized protein A4U43_C07F18600 [Asparagus officinalis]|uniref:Uncharacterized protein n=1 Tax=Asparagus officinalis TaxID=4686 RepID=A0A5P1ECZ3_ASPOF|nr:uncharacterized protein A4U43_C07F18600 [Asparagus officinalis]